MTWKHARNPGKITGLTVGSDGQMRWNRNPAGRYVIYAIPDGKSPAQAKDPSGMNYRPQYIVGVSYTNSYVLPDWLWDGTDTPWRRTTASATSGRQPSPSNLHKLHTPHTIHIRYIRHISQHPAR